MARRMTIVALVALALAAVLAAPAWGAKVLYRRRPTSSDPTAPTRRR